MSFEGIEYLEKIDLHGAISKWKSEIIVPGQKDEARPLPALPAMRNAFGIGYDGESLDHYARPQVHLWQGSPEDSRMEVLNHALRVRLMFKGKKSFPCLRILSEVGLFRMNQPQMNNIHYLLREAERSGAEAMKCAREGREPYTIRGLPELGRMLSEDVAQELTSITGSSHPFTTRNAMALIFPLLPRVKDGAVVADPLPLALSPGELEEIFTASNARSYMTQLAIRMVSTAFLKNHPSSLEDMFHLGLYLDFPITSHLEEPIAVLSPDEVHALVGLFSRFHSYEDGNGFLDEALERNLEYISIPRLVALSQMAQQYNWEWAVASFDWTR